MDMRTQVDVIQAWGHMWMLERHGDVHMWISDRHGDILDVRHGDICGCQTWEHVDVRTHVDVRQTKEHMWMSDTETHVEIRQTKKHMWMPDRHWNTCRCHTDTGTHEDIRLMRISH